MTIAADIYGNLVMAFGSDALVLAFALIFLTLVFFITRQSLSSSIVLGVVAMRGLVLIADQEFINILYYAFIILIGLGIGWAILRTTRRVS